MRKELLRKNPTLSEARADLVLDALLRVVLCSQTILSLDKCLCHLFLSTCLSATLWALQVDEFPAPLFSKIQVKNSLCFAIERKAFIAVFLKLSKLTYS